MQSLLRWGIENSAGSSSATGAAGEPSSSGGNQPTAKKWDPELVQALLGRPDSELMKENLEVAMDSSKDEETRLQALDNFEMLIEQIDNANDIVKMDMWKPVQQLLLSPESSDEIRASVLWIIGTAVQNNPAAQSAYLTLPNSPLQSILTYLSPSESSSATRSKAIYALSGLLKHNAKGVEELTREGGWETLKASLEDPDIRVRRKTVFLLNTLLIPSQEVETHNAEPSAALHGPGVPNSDGPSFPNSHASLTAQSAETSAETARALKEYGIIPQLVHSLIDPLPHGVDGDQIGDAEFEEKLVRLFSTYLTSSRGQITDPEKTKLREWFRSRSHNFDLGQEEVDSLQKALE